MEREESHRIDKSTRSEKNATAICGFEQIACETTIKTKMRMILLRREAGDWQEMVQRSIEARTGHVSLIVPKSTNSSPGGRRSLLK
jgi:hypothetical protein